MYVTKTPIPEEWRIEISRYLQNIQRNGGLKDDGWGMWVDISLSRYHSTDSEFFPTVISNRDRVCSARL